MHRSHSSCIQDSTDAHAGEKEILDWEESLRMSNELRLGDA